MLARAAAAIGTDSRSERLDRDIDVRTEPATSAPCRSRRPTRTRREPRSRPTRSPTRRSRSSSSGRPRGSEEAGSDLAARSSRCANAISRTRRAIVVNPPDVETRTAERDALIRQLGSRARGPGRRGLDRCVYTTIDEAERGTKQERLPGTRSRAERMALAGRVALVLGFGLALTLDRSDTRVRTRRDAEEHFGFPVIAEVVKFPFWFTRRRMVVVRRTRDRRHRVVPDAAQRPDAPRTATIDPQWNAGSTAPPATNADRRAVAAR